MQMIRLLLYWNITRLVSSSCDCSCRRDPWTSHSWRTAFLLAVCKHRWGLVFPSTPFTSFSLSRCCVFRWTILLSCSFSHSRCIYQGSYRLWFPLICQPSSWGLHCLKKQSMPSLPVAFLGWLAWAGLDKILALLQLHCYQSRWYFPMSQRRQKWSLLFLGCWSSQYTWLCISSLLETDQ